MMMSYIINFYYSYLKFSLMERLHARVELLWSCFAFLPFSVYTFVQFEFHLERMTHRVPTQSCTTNHSILQYVVDSQGLTIERCIVES